LPPFAFHTQHIRAPAELFAIRSSQRVCG